MHKTETFNLFVCLIILIGALVSLAYYAVTHGHLLAVQEGKSLKDDFVRAERFNEVRRNTTY